MSSRPARGTVVRPLSVETLVTVVNEWGDAARQAASEESDPYPDPPVATSDPAVARATRDELVDAANAVYPVFAGATSERMADVLNSLIAELGLRPQFVGDGRHVAEVWTAPTSSLKASAALTLLLQFRAVPDSRRVGVCEGDACGDVYVDTSPGARRRYCSVTCQNRVRARTYRARLHET